MRTWLPPLLLLALFGWVGLTTAKQPSRPLVQERLRGVLRAGQAEAIEGHLKAYRERFETPEDVWFVAELLLRTDRVDRAITLVFEDPRLAEQPGTARRFAVAALEVMGWEDPERDVMTQSGPAALSVLVEAGVVWARELLTEVVATRPLGAITHFLRTIPRGSDSVQIRIIADGLRQREGEDFQVAGAMTAIDAGLEPRRDSDEAAVRRVLASEAWRREAPLLWQSAAYAMGQLGHEQVLAERLEALPDTLADELDGKALRAALLASGDWTQSEALAASYMNEATLDTLITTWVLEALLHLHRNGDEEARHVLGSIWTHAGVRSRHLRERIASALLLGPQAPDESALPVRLMVRDLQSQGAPLSSHMLVRAYALRRGDAGAEQAVLELLAKAFRSAGAAGSEGGGGLVALVGLRALLLYSDPATRDS